MVDFLKIDLENYGQPAIARLRDEIEYGDVIIVQAHFNEDNTTISRLRSDRKPKIFQLNTKEMDTLCAAWLDYQARIAAYKAEQEAAEQAMIAEARTLIESTHFDLEALNIQLDKDDDGDWRIQIPAISLIRYCRHTKDLNEALQEVLDKIKKDVERTERHSWNNTGEWKTIVASYRRVFPLEPQEIQQARKMLIEAGITGYTLIHCHPEPTADCWSFVLDETNQDSFALIDKPAEDMLELIDQYVTMTKQGIWTADFQPLNIVDDRPEQGESALKVKVNLQAPDRDAQLDAINEIARLSQEAGMY